MIGGFKRPVVQAGLNGGPVKRIRAATPVTPVTPATPATPAAFVNSPAATTAEVRFSNAQEAATALHYHGSMIRGVPITVQADSTSKDGTKVIVEGLPGTIPPNELKAHFAECGTVIWAGPPKKVGGGQANSIGEVRFESPEEAAQAVAALHGSTIEGATITAMLDQSSRDFSKVILTGLPSGLQWQELKDHCSLAGKVAYAEVRSSSFTAPQASPIQWAQWPQWPDMTNFAEVEGEVRYDAAEHAMTAMQQLNGSTLGGNKIWIRMDPNSMDNTRLTVSGIPASVQWQELKDHFSCMGTVAFAQVKRAQAGMYGMPALGCGTGMLGKAAVAAGAGTFGKPAAPVAGKGMVSNQWGLGKQGNVVAGKAANKGGWTGNRGSSGVGEIRFDSPQHAQLAITRLNGSMMQGSKLTVTSDSNSQDGSKVVAYGVPASCQWQELKDHFAQVGQVAYANILAPGGPGEVRMETAEEAQRALAMLHGADVMGCIITVAMDRCSKDGTRLIVGNLPPNINWQQMKDIFSQAGTVAFATRAGVH